MVIGVTGVYHDDGIYLSTAKALAEGHGYRLINLPDAPPQTKYPPLYSILLSLIWKVYPVFPSNLFLMQLFTLICGGAFVSLTYLYLIRFGYASRFTAAASAVLTLSATQFLYFSTQILSEIPFALLSIMALWGLDKQEEGFFKSRKMQFLLGALVSLPFLTRMIGIIFFPLLFYRMWVRKLPFGWTTLGSAVLLLPWIFWILTAFQWSPIESSNIYYTDYFTWWYTYLKSDFSNVILWNLLYIAISSASLGNGLLNPNLFFTGWALAFTALVGVVIWSLIAVNTFKGRILPVFLSGYLIIILAWPWPPTRFLVPILPFILVYPLNCMENFLKKISNQLHFRKMFSLTLLPILLTNLTLVSKAIQVSRSMNYPLMAPIEYPVSWKSYNDLFQWIEKQTHADDIIASGLDTMVYVYTGRQGFRPFVANPMSMFYGKKDVFALGSEEEIIQMIKAKNAQYLVQLPMPYFSEEKYFSEAIRGIEKKYPELLKKVYKGTDERFIIYKIMEE